MMSKRLLLVATLAVLLAVSTALPVAEEPRKLQEDDGCGLSCWMLVRARARAPPACASRKRPPATDALRLLSAPTRAALGCAAAQTRTWYRNTMRVWPGIYAKICPWVSNQCTWWTENPELNNSPPLGGPGAAQRIFGSLTSGKTSGPPPP